MLNDVLEQVRAKVILTGAGADFFWSAVPAPSFGMKMSRFKDINFALYKHCTSTYF